MEERSSASLGARVLAVLVLAVATWLLLKVVIGIVTGLALMVAVIFGVVAVAWAVRTLL